MDNGPHTILGINGSQSYSIGTHERQNDTPYTFSIPNDQMFHDNFDLYTKQNSTKLLLTKSNSIQQTRYCLQKQ